MKFLYVTDPHLKGRNPARRLDDYPSEILTLFYELFKVSQKIKPTAVLIGGDLFDTPKISLRLYNKISRVLKRFSMPIYIVPGNHDIFGMNADNLQDTMLGALEASGVITIINRENSPIAFSGDGVTINLYGQEYYGDIDKNNWRDDYTVPVGSTADWNFLMTHGMLLDKPFHPDVPHTLVKDVAKNTNAHVIFGAHYHPGWGVIEEGDVTFIHPGAMARLEGTKVEATRPVQYALVDVDDEGLAVDLVSFKSARNGQDILDLSTGAAKHQHQAALDVFRKTVDDAVKFESLNPQDVLQSIGQEMIKAGTLPTALACAEQALVDAETNADDFNTSLQGFIEDNGQVSLEWLEISNFQSHEDTRFEFDTNGLNAIIGASDSGKTAAIRALKFLLYNEPKGTDFIRHGASKVTVRGGFTNGYILERNRTQSSSGEYVVTDSQGVEQVYKGFAHNIPIEVTNAHQMPKTQLSKDLETTLNIAYQLDGPFLIGEGTSSRASVIGRLTGVHVVDSAIRETNRKVSGLQRDIKSDIAREKDLEERLQNDFLDIEPLAQEVSELELILYQLDKLEKKLSTLKDIEGDYTQACKSIQSSTAGLLEVEPVIKTLTEVEAKLTGAVATYKLYTELNDNLSSVQKTIRQATKELKTCGDGQSAIGCLAAADSFLVRLKEVKRLQEETQRNADAIDYYSNELKSLPLVSDEQLEEIADKIEQAKELRNLQRDYQAEVEIIEKADKSISGFEEAFIETKEQYKEVLKDMGKCPTCFTPIDDTIIDQIEL